MKERVDEGLPQTYSAFVIVMELAMEKDLYELITDSNITSSNIDHSLILFGYILYAIKVLYKAGFAHLDIKVENIVLSRKQCLPKIIDLGMSNLIHNRVSNYALKGTPNISCDDILINNEKTSEIVHETLTDGSQTDVFQLGVVLFFLIFGVVPFHRDDKEIADYYPLIKN